ncbi:hypothetical protein PC129_g14391 [Phytophthora cactorum]|uniref:Integrase catalytic domain-containing protein n=1 Tax=Phytophthora cactorum TaxID=29920 RepID=A0A329RRA5_9STRA|nr:hypothetical protein PC114_g14166 [Phytophthora cactorum]KAG2922190.1 hypothetical protein PC117_g16027 [Phytophthora cactorum]KAG2986443.1 hypothetical protein PC119_g19902 [Phytophthora cactorum]KAG3147908.1 hypothetical protein C6341_g17570 [Phytophthora cactorum]KAG3214709.1 hypothetical protein PC129_g14391 [Phytophthora cactorum]
MYRAFGWRCVHGSICSPKQPSSAYYANIISDSTGQNIGDVASSIGARTAGGTKFLNNDLRKLAHNQGILLQHTAPYAAFQNGVAERTIRTVTETAAAKLMDAGLPPKLWEYTLQPTTYVCNPILRRGATITQHEPIFGQ